MAIIEPNMEEAVQFIKPGSYPAVITKEEVKESKKNPGTYYVEWTMETTKCTTEKLNGTKLPIYRTMFTGRAAGQFENLYRACVGNNEATVPTQFDTQDLCGQVVYATITPQRDAPQYNEVKRVAPYKEQTEKLA